MDRRASSADNYPEGMVTRAESAATTRRALLDAAGALLDKGGPDAVTLREVGANAGVSRSAPYRHFADKESLLTAIASESWSAVGDDLEALTADACGSPEETLRRALLLLIAIGRSRPHLYRLMFATTTADPTAGVQAAERAQGFFLHLVTGVVGAGSARQHAALLLTGAHGMTGLEMSGHLSPAKWGTTPEELLDLQIGLLPRSS